MKLYAPKYYNEFKCIADRCRHSCCVGWEIDIDGDTLDRYASLKAGYGKKIIDTIDTEGTPHFRLAEGERCPHLDGTGLCRIISELGEGYLCDICKEHPRFYNYTGASLETGLGMSCEEACRIILCSDDYRELVELGECDGEEAFDIDVVSLRNRIYSLLSDRARSYRERIDAICREFGVPSLDARDGEIRELFDSLEYLEPSHKELFKAYCARVSLPCELEIKLERAFAYFVYRHCSEDVDTEGYRASLCLCVILERALASAAMALGESIEEAARVISEEIEYSEDNTESLRAFAGRIMI